MEVIHHLEWVHPDECVPPHKVGRPEQVEQLSMQFIQSGWGVGYPALVGYFWKGTIQLLSGSHRWAASKAAELEKIPVAMVPYAVVQESWGNLEKWARVMSAPVVNLND